MTALRRNFLLFGALLAVAAGVTPAPGQVVGQIASPAAAPAGGAVQAASIPDLSGSWRHMSLPGFEPLPSGPRPVTNRSRFNGVSNYNQLVGDYTNPILKPWAAEVVKKYGELSLKGITFPSPANQCWPEPVPYIYKNFGVLVIQQPQRVLFLYDEAQEFRSVRLNEQHPKDIVPSWHGDSVGHYDGDTLVVDTVGIKADRRYAMIDLFGTPYTHALHIVERYRVIDYETAKEALERDRRENMLPPGSINPNYRGKHLQLLFTIQDDNVFTTPWSATITYRGFGADWQEIVCAENIQEYYNNKESDVPRADKPDF
jgi:hypothetical protein